MANKTELKVLISEFISTGFGIGYLPIKKGQGTIASILAFIIYYLMFILLKEPVIWQINLLVILFTLGWLCVKITEEQYGCKDDPRIVIDEIIGYFVSILFLQETLAVALVGLILFRIFDIIKLPIIRRVEKLNGSAGVILDDVVAGVITNIILRFFIAFGIV